MILLASLCVTETILCQDPKVQAAVIFGRERPFNGVILAPRPEFVFDPRDGEALAAFRDSVWYALSLTAFNLGEPY